MENTPSLFCFFFYAYSTFAKNCCSRSLLGFSKISLGLPSSTCLPSAMNITRVPTSFAKPISCVTTTIVMLSFASYFITSSTSPTISGSSAEVGSSNSITSGSMQSARTMAIRCFCPPES